MSETETTGVADSGPAGNTGTTDHGSSDHGSTNSRNISDVKERAYAEMQRSEDPTDTLAEIRDRKAEKEGDTTVHSPERKEARLDRIKRALDRARSEGDDTQSESSPQVTEAAPERDVAQDQAEVIHRHRLEAQVELRVNEYAKKNPDFMTTVRETFSVFPPAEHFADAILESPVAPQILHEFAKHPEAIERVNAMSPRELTRFIGQLEGQIHANEQSTVQANTPNRRRTNAPAPIGRMPGGGASPSKSIAQMAKNENASELIAHWRKEREAKAARR